MHGFETEGALAGTLKLGGYQVPGLRASNIGETLCTDLVEGVAVALEGGRVCVKDRAVCPEKQHYIETLFNKVSIQVDHTTLMPVRRRHSAGVPLLYYFTHVSQR